MTATIAGASTRPAASARLVQLPWDLFAAIAATAVFAVAALWPALLATQGPFAMDLADTLAPPSSAHWFGTDESGRDLYSRVIYGTAASLGVGIGAALVSLTLAVILGSLAALGNRPTRAAVGWLLEVAFAFPALLLSLLLIAVLGPSILTLILAVGVGTAPGYARMVRGQILSAQGAPYVEAAVALGHSGGRILRQHILPNSLRPLVAVFALSIGQSIVWASSLSFLGLGIAPPAPEWGALLDAGRSYITVAGWLTVIPGLVIVVLALTTTTLGRHLQSFLEKGEK
ncbi:MULTISPECIES: ABC transporter permease [unclassified Leifsonia]|uniref:ABC transporter permease n=1 Tax=unclassified Leifsonia TaxID=2663824 RepID=UPI0006F7CF6C|nr:MULTISPECIES: ABC transporter permease [unclassified Leifsonia]KQX04960.1 peptide ABC transporter permease [Leifsonia sp. Root1293]KRA08592.1 peptide ABC transporter permease [Leifsonia sp. Root60]